MTTDNVFSASIKGGNKTYFLDIKRAKNGNPYLVITESQIQKGEGKAKRSSIIVFKENCEGFENIVHNACKAIHKID